MQNLRTATATAFGISALFVLFGSGFFLWWHYYAPRPIIAPFASEIAEKARTLQDAEALRNMTLALSQARTRDSELVEHMLNTAVGLTCITALGAAIALTSYALKVRTAIRDGAPGDA